MPNIKLTRSILRTLRRMGNAATLEMLQDLSVADGVFKYVKDARPAIKKELARLEAKGRVVVESQKRIILVTPSRNYGKLYTHGQLFDGRGNLL